MLCPSYSAAAAVVLAVTCARAQSAPEYGIAVPGKFPVLMERTPYGSGKAEPWASYFVPRGYIALAPDVRGRFGSEGRWFPLRDNVQDGYDMARWIGEQLWFNGKLGLWDVLPRRHTARHGNICNAPHLAPWRRLVRFLGNANPPAPTLHSHRGSSKVLQIM